MATFITPFSGTAELTASTGLAIQSQGIYTFSGPGFNDGATFGLSLTHPKPQSGGELHLSAQNWTIADIGNDLSSYTDPDTGITYPASRCRITVRGRWQVIRQQNSNSFNGIGVEYTGATNTDLGSREMNPWLLTFTSDYATYIKQGADVTGGAQDTFSTHTFFCRATESASSDNSNKEYQSNTITRPTFVYSYSKSWQTD